MDTVDIEGNRDALERFKRDGDYLQEHWKELLRQYPEMWVAVYNQQVVGADNDLERLVGQLKKRGIPPGEAPCEYLTRHEDLLILGSLGL